MIHSQPLASKPPVSGRWPLVRPRREDSGSFHGVSGNYCYYYDCDCGFVSVDTKNVTFTMFHERGHKKRYVYNGFVSVDKKNVTFTWVP